MNLQEQLQKPQRLTDTPLASFSSNLGVLGNKLAQSPLVHGKGVVIYQISLRGSVRPAFKLASLKQRKFTVEGREQRIATSLAALNASQPTELTVAEWKATVEEVEDDD
jgi:hypothetical protein